MPFHNTVAYAFLLLACVVVPLLIAAAIVENCITPLIISNIR